MKTENITIQVDAKTAKAYKAASEEDRLKINSLLNLKLRSATRSQISLKALMDKISDKATKRGLTPDELNSILSEK